MHHIIKIRIAKNFKQAHSIEKWPCYTVYDSCVTGWDTAIKNNKNVASVYSKKYKSKLLKTKSQNPLHRLSYNWTKMHICTLRKLESNFGVIQIVSILGSYFLEEYFCSKRHPDILNWFTWLTKDKYINWLFFKMRKTHFT